MAGGDEDNLSLPLRDMVNTGGGDQPTAKIEVEGGGGGGWGAVQWVLLVMGLVVVGALIYFVVSGRFTSFVSGIGNRIMSIGPIKAFSSRFATILPYGYNRTMDQFSWQQAFGGSSYKVSSYGKTSEKSWEGPSMAGAAEESNKILFQDVTLTREQFTKHGSTMFQVLVENTGTRPVAPATMVFRGFSEMGKLGGLNFNPERISRNKIDGGERIQYSCNTIEPESWACSGNYQGISRSFIVEALFKGGYQSSARLDLEYIQDEYYKALVQAQKIELSEKKAINSGGPAIVGIQGPQQPITDKRNLTTLSFAITNQGKGKVSKGEISMVVGMPEELYNSTNSFECFSSSQIDIEPYKPYNISGCEELTFAKECFAKGIKSSLLLSRNPYKGYVFCPVLGCKGEPTDKGTCSGPPADNSPCVKDPIVYPSINIDLANGQIKGDLDLGQNYQDAQVNVKVWYYSDPVPGSGGTVTLTDTYCNDEGECQLENISGITSFDVKQNEEGPYFAQIAVNDSCGETYIATKAAWHFTDSGVMPKPDTIYLPKEVSGFYSKKLLDEGWVICLKGNARPLSQGGDTYNIQTNVPDLEIRREMKSIVTDLVYGYRKRTGKEVKVLC